MSTWINVARIHLVDRTTFTVMPLGVLAFIFGLNLVSSAAIPPGATGTATLTGTAFGIYATFACLGALTSRSLAFGLSLGVSRRTYYTGSALLCLGLAAGFGLLLAALQVVERATGGWGMGMQVFRLPHVLTGPWALAWLTPFVCLTLLWAYGMWFGIVFRLWNVVGVLIFGASQITAVLAAILLITWTHAGPHLVHALTRLTPTGLTGLLALLAMAMFACGYATIRRATV